MRKIFGVCSLTAALVCASCSSDLEYDQPDSALRCGAKAAVSIVALGSADISGTVSLLGSDRGALFANDGVTMNGGVLVESDVYSAGSITLNGGSAEVLGERHEGAEYLEMEPDFEGANAAELSNNNAELVHAGKSPIKDGALKLSGRSVLWVPAGTYYLENGLSVSGQAQLMLKGDATIYVNGTVSLTGTTSTNDGAPHRLNIVSVGSDSIKLSGSSQAQLNISAPMADVALSGTTAFGGTIVGRDIRISGTADIGMDGDAAFVSTACDPLGGAEGEPVAPSDGGLDGTPEDLPDVEPLG